MPESDGQGNGFAALARFLKSPSAKTTPGERCELCAAPLQGDHSHVVDVRARRLMCACRPCYLLFKPGGAAQGKYKAVPDRCLHLTGFTLTEAQWEALQIPIGLAFFFVNGESGKTAAFYPSPAGATESLLPLATWEEVVAANPELFGLQPDVEAILVRRTREGPQECFLVPIDACYELVGIIRAYWKGFDGGQKAWQEIDRFFERLRAKSCSSQGLRSP